MGEVQATPLVADLNGDGDLEVLATDTKGNVACFDVRGRVLWKRNIGQCWEHEQGASCRSLAGWRLMTFPFIRHPAGSSVTAAAFAGDYDGDGELEVTFGAHSGEVFLVRGSTGLDIRPFPFMTRGRIRATPLMVDLGQSILAKPEFMDIVVASMDGFLYVIDGETGCAEALDIGEASYSMVLADDLDNDGTLDLVLTTVNGNIFLVETEARYHPLKAWTGPFQQPNGMVSKDRYYGVFVTSSSRAPRDLRGTSFPVQFSIVDRRGYAARNASMQRAYRKGQGQYRVMVMLEGVGVTDMKSGDYPVIGMSDSYRTSGSHTLQLLAPRTRTTATVSVRMVDEHGLVFQDSFSLSFHVNFYRMLKWVVVLPFALLALWASLVIGKGDPFEETLLPTTRPHDRID